MAPKEIQEASPASEQPPAEADVQPIAPESVPEPAPTPPPESAPETPEADDGPKSILEAIQSVIKPEDAPADGEAAADPAEPGDADPAGEPPAQDGQDADLEADELSDEDKKILKPNAQKRFTELLKQRKIEREGRQTAETELARVQPDVARMRVVDDFMSNAGLSGEDMQTSFRISAILKSGDHRAFLAEMAPFIKASQVALGETLPDDLQAMVADGRLLEDDAKNLSRERQTLEAQNATLAANTARETARVAEVQKAQGSENAKAVKTAVDEWVVKRQASDPDYARNEEAVTEAVELHVLTKGVPASPADALAAMEAIYAKVSKRFGASLPKPVPPKPTRPTPDGLSSAPKAAAPKEPTSIIEAMEQGLRAAAAN